MRLLRTDLGFSNISTLLRIGPLLAVFFLSCLVLAACSGDNKLVVHSANGDHDFTVEIASTPDERAMGLMFREELGPNAGMLFDFQEEREVSFWMQNTLIPLDMIFIGTDGVIRKVHVNARPRDTTSIPSGEPVRFVLEIPGGRSVELGISVGDRVDHPLIGS